MPSRTLEMPLSYVDPQVAAVLNAEVDRQRSTLEMIASENFAPRAILECQGSVLTNKYAEGYPGRRDYGGCENADVSERLAIARAKRLFGAEHVNVQPDAGAQANDAVYHALLEPGDEILGLDAIFDGVDPASGLIEMDAVAEQARRERPKMIVAGWSAYPRQLDFAAFRAIADEVGALLMVDMAHFAGLVAARLYPSPFPHADVVTTTLHQTLNGPRSGMILTRERHARQIDSAVFPGQQGGHLEHVVAAKAVALKLAGEEEFRERQRRTVAGARAVAAALEEAQGGVSVLTGGTDVHFVLVDLRDSELDGQVAEQRLGEVGITVSRSAMPFDPRPPIVSSGLRIGTSALATRGLDVADFAAVGSIIGGALGPGFESRRDDLRASAAAIAARFPLYPYLGFSPT
jgi:glycine hydroxymethyltransferase